MVIYGVALLAGCTLLGIGLGKHVGALLGIDANVGGVGIAMILLLLVTGMGRGKFKLKPITAGGITFFSAMYIPIVVAMAAKQNVFSALSGGWMAALAGILAVLAGFALVPVLTKFQNRS